MRKYSRLHSAEMSFDLLHSNFNCCLKLSPKLSLPLEPTIKMTERNHHHAQRRTRNERPDPLAGLSDVAANLRIRAALMTVLKQRVIQTGLGQAQAAKLFQVTQPRISGLMCGKVALFGLDALVNMACAAGLRVELSLGSAAEFKARFSTPLGLPRPAMQEAPPSSEMVAEPPAADYKSSSYSLKRLLLLGEATRFDWLLEIYLQKISRSHR